MPPSTGRRLSLMAEIIPDWPDLKPVKRKPKVDTNKQTNKQNSFSLARLCNLLAMHFDKQTNKKSNSQHFKGLLSRTISSCVWWTGDFLPCVSKSKDLWSEFWLSFSSGKSLRVWSQISSSITFLSYLWMTVKVVWIDDTHGIKNMVCKFGVLHIWTRITGLVGTFSQILL